MTVTMYSFENADGGEDTFTTFSAVEAKERGQRDQLRVIANEFEFSDSEVAWDFTPGANTEEETKDAEHRRRY